MSDATLTAAIPAAPPAQTARQSVDPQVMRHVLGSYPTGVAVITGCTGDGTPIGMVVGTFSSVSMSPPLVSFMPMVSSRTFADLRTCASFVVNILAADQEEVCGAFMGAPEEKFRKIEWRRGALGGPIIEGVTAWIECSWADVIEAGDHYFVLGAIESLAVERNALPLLFFQRGYGSFTPGLMTTSDHRSLAAAIGVAERGRDEIERLASDIGAAVSLQAPLGDEFAFVATAADRGATHSTLPGTRMPFVPPLGMLMVDQPGAPTRATWLDHAPGKSPELREAAERQLRRVQERGWSLTLRGPIETATLDELVDAYSDPARTPESERRLIEALRQMAQSHEPERIEVQAIYSVLQLSVPVCGSDGQVALVLRASGFDHEISGAEVLAMIDRLRRTAGAIENKVCTSACPLPPGDTRTSPASVALDTLGAPVARYDGDLTEAPHERSGRS